MSQENVEVVRRHIEAFGNQDTADALSWLDPHVVLDRSRGGALDAGTVYGREAVDHAVTHYVGAFRGYHYDVERLTDLGAGAVLAVVTETGSGKTSGVLVRHSIATLYTVLDGKIVRITTFPSEEEALEAAGLSE
jgi:ketosteroid isomerase-like protein